MIITITKGTFVNNSGIRLFYFTAKSDDDKVAGGTTKAQAIGNLIMLYNPLHKLEDGTEIFEIVELK